MADLKRKVEILSLKFRMMEKMKFNLDKGLDKFFQGRENPIKAIECSIKQA